MGVYTMFCLVFYFLKASFSEKNSLIWKLGQKGRLFGGCVAPAAADNVPSFLPDSFYGFAMGCIVRFYVYVVVGCCFFDTDVIFFNAYFGLLDIDFGLLDANFGRLDIDYGYVDADYGHVGIDYGRVYILFILLYSEFYSEYVFQSLIFMSLLV